MESITPLLVDRPSVGTRARPLALSEASTSLTLPIPHVPATHFCLIYMPFQSDNTLTIHSQRRLFYVDKEEEDLKLQPLMAHTCHQARRAQSAGCVTVFAFSVPHAGRTCTGRLSMLLVGPSARDKIQPLKFLGALSRGCPVPSERLTL